MRPSRSTMLIASGAGNAREPALTLGGEGYASANVLACKLRKIGKYLILAHPACHVRKHIADGDTSAADGRLPESNIRVEDDAVTIIHA